MSINTEQMKEYVVEPVLKALELGGTEIMLGIAAVESNMGTYIHQVKGPAKGLWQVEATTHDDVWRYLLRKNDPNKTRTKRLAWAQYLAGCDEAFFDGYSCIDGSAIRHWRDGKTYQQYHDRLIYDLRYCCTIARLKLYMIPAKLPDHDDVLGRAQYWDKYYNCNPDKGTPKEFIDKYNKYVSPYI